MNPELTAETLAALRQLDTCTIANAIESFEVRLRNEGFMGGAVRCLSPRLGPLLGYAATLKIRCSTPPPRGHAYPDRNTWWDHILALPAPRVVVIQDVDPQPGTGAFLGEVHAHVLLALGCVGAITNGSVRDVPAVEAAGLQLFAGGLAVSHAYSHIVEVGGPVTLDGLTIHPGDLLHGDRHGVVSIPKEIAAHLPSAAARLSAHEQKIIADCHAGDISLEKLRTILQATP